MSMQSPPRLLERALLLFLTARDRETISGDLLEDYREERLPRLGPLRANLWYLRQSLSLASVRIIGGPHVNQMLIAISCFTTAAAVWLAVMENILKHPGYPQRTAIAACIALQSLATLLFFFVKGRSIFRAIVLAGALGIGILGASVLANTLQAAHFEGYSLIISVALMLQAALTLLAMSSFPPFPSPRRH